MLLDHVADDELRKLYEQASATVFASWEEGFGLPVLESLWHGRPCLCHEGSAMAELLPGGGAFAVDMLDEAEIEAALVSLADDLDLLERLGHEAVDAPASGPGTSTRRTFSAPSPPPGRRRVGRCPAIVRRRPLLTCAITTYNRAPWLRHSLPRLLEVTQPVAGRCRGSRLR